MRKKEKSLLLTLCHLCLFSVCGSSLVFSVSGLIVLLGSAMAIDEPRIFFRVNVSLIVQSVKFCFTATVYIYLAANICAGI